MNDLTEKLFSEGYTPENHPENVEWHSGWREFQYTKAAAILMVWETPCGLLRKGCIQDACGNGSFMGVTYSIENGNLRIGCPYYYKDRFQEYSERECARRDPKTPPGWNCTTHRTDRPYDYEQSVEKIQDAWNKVKSAAHLEAVSGYGFCVCMEFNFAKRKYVPNYHVMNCINIGCKNEVCAVTRRSRNLERVNIFYDLLWERHYKRGLFELTDRSIKKGVKQFKHPVARTDAEIWLKKFGKNLEPHLTRDDRRELHFSKYHGKTGYGEYDWCEYSVTVQNVRIERRASKDLLQDLRDVQEGIEVIHASDLIKQAAQAKRDRIKKRKEDKARRLEKRAVDNMKRILGQEDASEALKIFASKELSRRGILPEPEIEQPRLF